MRRCWRRRYCPAGDPRLKRLAGIAPGRLTLIHGCARRVEQKSAERSNPRSAPRKLASFLGALASISLERCSRNCCDSCHRSGLNAGGGVRWRTQRWQENLVGYTGCIYSANMSTGFELPIQPMPSYSIEEEWACRTCSRVKIRVTVEYPHPRMRLDCDYSMYVPLQVCEYWQREPGTD